MMGRQGDLFGGRRAVRPPVKRAHVVDAGDGQPGFPFGARFECKCGWLSDWLCFDKQSEIRRGIACEPCNGATS